MLAGIENLLRGALGWEPNPSAVNERGVRLFAAGHVREALAEFDRAIAAAPYFAWAWYNRAACSALLGEHQSAIEDCTRAIEIEPRWGAAYNGRGLSHYALKQHAQALADFQQAIALDPRDLAQYVNRAAASVGLGQYDNAVTDATYVLERDPKCTAAYHHRSIALGCLGQGELALADADQVVALSEASAEYLFHRANLRLRLEHYEAAVEDCQRVLAVDPQQSAALQISGTSRYFLGQFAAAIQDLSACLQLNPDDALAANNRGVSYFLVGQYAQAEADLSRTTVSFPQFASAWKNFAWMRATCPEDRYRDGAESVQMATHALELVHWDQPQWLEVLAAAYAECGDFAAAVEWQQKALAALTVESDSPAARRLWLYQSQTPFRHVLAPGEPVELIPGGRALKGADGIQSLSSADNSKSAGMSGDSDANPYAPPREMGYQPPLAAKQNLLDRPLYAIGVIVIVVLAAIGSMIFAELFD